VAADGKGRKGERKSILDSKRPKKKKGGRAVDFSLCKRKARASMTFGGKRGEGRERPSRHKVTRQGREEGGEERTPWKSLPGSRRSARGEGEERALSFAQATREGRGTGRAASRKMCIRIVQGRGGGGGSLPSTRSRGDKRSAFLSKGKKECISFFVTPKSGKRVF